MDPPYAHIIIIDIMMSSVHLSVVEAITMITDMRTIVDLDIDLALVHALDPNENLEAAHYLLEAVLQIETQGAVYYIPLLFFFPFFLW